MSRLDKLRVAVVGAGPAGTLFALLAAKRGMDVTLFDRESVYSSPCGEAIPGPSVAYWGSNKAVWRLVGEAVERTRLNEVYGFGLHLPGKVVVSRQTRPLGYVVNKATFVAVLRNMASMHGAKLVHRSVDVYRLAESGEYDVVVDARGPHTDTAVRRMAVIRAYAEGGYDLDRSLIHFWFAPGIIGYFWAFPRGGMWNVGVGCLGCRAGDLEQLYQSYMEAEGLEERPRTRRGWSIIAEPPGRPVAEIIRRRDGATLLLRVGEAAGHVMYHTGEGIRPALLSAYTTFKALEKALTAPSNVTLPGASRYINAHVQRSRVHKDAQRSYAILQMMERLHKRRALLAALSLLPKRAWYNLFKGADPVLVLLAKTVAKLL